MYEMKDSGIEWIGKIPIDWDMRRLRYLVSIDTGNKDTQDKVDNGLYPFYVRSDVIERINSYSYDGEAILTAGDGVGVGRVFHYVKGKFAYHQRVYKLSKFKDIKGKYLYYYVLENFHKEVMKLSAKSTVDSLRRPMFSDFPVAFPTASLQKKIANFLDLKTAEFDSIISKKELLIEKLEEAKKSLISEVVTGKVKIVNGELVERKPDEMKDSGIECLGMIPKEYCTADLAYLSKNVTDGAHISPDTENGTELFISVRDIISNRIDFENCLLTTKENYKYLERTGCKPDKGDVLISKDGTLGKTVVIDYDKDFVVSSSLIIIKPKKEIDPSYLEYVLNSSYYQEQVKMFARGAALPRISIINIKRSIIVYTKNKLEQENLINYLNKKVFRLNSIITKTKVQIQKLKEAKQSLISEAVTGKIDLRDWEIQGI